MSMTRSDASLISAGLVTFALLGCSSATSPPDVAGASGGGAVNGGRGGAASMSGGASNATGGSNSSGGRSSSGGTAATGGGIATGGNAGSGATGPAQSCSTPPQPGLPQAAPKLTPGTWLDISPSQVPFGTANTQGMAVDPCNPSVLYLCVAALDANAGHPGVYKSTDAGATWSKVGPLDTPLHIRIDPKDPNHLYANDGVWGSTQGFFVSTDGGNSFVKPKSWTDLATNNKMFIDDTYDVVADPSDFNHLLVTFHSSWGWTDTKWNGNAGVLESTDGGGSWIVHEPQSGWGAGHAINFLYRPDLGIGNANTWLLGTQGGGLFRTSDAGGSWTKVSDLGIQHGGGTIYYTKKGVLYASGAYQNQRSTDNGLTWTKIGPGEGYNGIIGDGRHLYTGKCFGPAPFITSSEDDGLTWADYNSQKFTQGPFEFGYDAVNDIVYSASWQSGMWALKPK